MSKRLLIPLKQDVFDKAKDDTLPIKFAFALLFQLLSIITAVVSEANSVDDRVSSRLVMKFVALVFFALGILSKVYSVFEAQDILNDIPERFLKQHTYVLREGKFDKVKQDAESTIDALDDKIKRKCVEDDSELRMQLRFLQLFDESYLRLNRRSPLVVSIVGLLLLFCIIAEIIGLFYEHIPSYLAVGITTAAPLLAEIVLGTYKTFILNSYKFSLSSGFDIQNFILTNYIKFFDEKVMVPTPFEGGLINRIPMALTEEGIEEVHSDDDDMMPGAYIQPPGTMLS